MKKQNGITCDFKTGIILRNKVVLSPCYNPTHVSLLESLNIADTRTNAMRVFVKAMLVPPQGDISAPINQWKFEVDQDILPEWFEKDRKRYEDEMRQEVSSYIKNNFVQIANLYWTPIELEDKIIYLLFTPLFLSIFGDTNNYKTSIIREWLNNGELLKELKQIYKDKLLPLSLDLTSMDGLKHYGKINEDYLSLMDLNIYRKYREYIPTTENFWLATSDSTGFGRRDDLVRYIDSNGSIKEDFCDNIQGVRPFFMIRK